MHFVNSIPLLAANLEWIVPAIVVFVMVIRIIGAAIGGNNPNVPNRRPPGAPQIPNPQGGDNDALKGEIEEFLRRVSNRREGQPQQRAGANPSRPASVPRPSQPTSPQDRRRRPAPLIIATAGTPVLAEVVESPGSRDDIDDHVKRYLNTRQFDQRADNLTKIDQQERQFDRQVQQTFAHEVGHLKPSSLAPPADDRSISETAPQVVDDQVQQSNSFALLTGSNLINAVVVSEIMNRPEHRW